MIMIGFFAVDYGPSFPCLPCRKSKSVWNPACCTSCDGGKRGSHGSNSEHHLIYVFN